MSTLDDLLAPLNEETFRSAFYGRRAIQIPARPGSPRENMFGWSELFDLVEVLPQWRSGGLQLIMDSKPVDPAHYIASREDGSGRFERPEGGLIDAMMAMGASLVLNSVEDVRIDLRRWCSVLGQAFAAKAGVNIYCSQAGVQAFASHCDPHDVFVVHCEGEKEWRIYEGREDAPTESTMLRDQPSIDRAKGAVATIVTLRPGELLYIPRGVYHDAMAKGGRSLHLTFAVQPLYGIALLDLVRDLAMEDPAFRAFLPSIERQPEEVAAIIRLLSDRLAEKLQSPAMAEDIAVRQRTICPPPHDHQQPKPAKIWRRTSSAAHIDQPLEGSFISARGQKRKLRYLADVAAWMIRGSVFSEQQLRARFSHHPAEEIDDLLAWFADNGLIEQVAFAR